MTGRHYYFVCCAFQTSMCDGFNFICYDPCIFHNIYERIDIGTPKLV